MQVAGESATSLIAAQDIFCYRVHDSGAAVGLEGRVFFLRGQRAASQFRAAAPFLRCQKLYRGSETTKSAVLT